MGTDIKQANKQATNEVIRFAIITFSIIGGLYLLQRYVIHGFILNTPEYWCLLNWCGFAYLTARFEAMYFNHEIHSNFIDNVNEHSMLILIRVCLLIPLFVLTSWDITLSYMFVFPFVHDGAYYSMREKLVSGTYPKKWFDQSNTSTALLTKFFNPTVRTIFFIVGIGYIIFKSLYLYKFL